MCEQKKTEALEPKYRIMELIRKGYGELGSKTGLEQLAIHCRLRNKRTVSDWIKIPAGSDETISHLVLPLVLSFFDLKNENQLLSTYHKSLLKQTA